MYNSIRLFIVVLVFILGRLSAYQNTPENSVLPWLFAIVVICGWFALEEFE
jgi:hypothetical protein